MRLLPLFVVALTLSACATTRDSAALDPRDPMERFNRGVWGFNQAIDTVALKPAATVYRTVTPVPARRGLTRVLANLFEPLNALNSLLQGKPKRAAQALARFAVNSTIGVGGLADHATDLGIPEANEDFGQTLAVWGARKSPYLVLPILGPSTVRDGIGTGVTMVADPSGFVLDELGASDALKIGATALRAVNARSQAIDSGVDAFLSSSADPYATARDAYFQRREADIEDRTGAADADEEQRLLDDALREADPAAIEPSRDEVSPEAPSAEQPSQPEEAAIVDGSALDGENAPDRGNIAY